MTKCRDGERFEDLKLCIKVKRTSGAGVVSENTVGKAESLYDLDPLAVVMTESVNVRVNVLITASTGVCGVTVGGAGSIGNNIVVVVLCSSLYGAVGERVALLVESYYLEGVGNLTVTVRGNIKTAYAVVGNYRVSKVLLVTIYGVLICADDLVPRKLYFSALLIGRGNGDCHFTLAGEHVNVLRVSCNCHRASEREDEHEYSYE